MKGGIKMDQTGIRFKVREDYGDGSYYLGEMLDGYKDGRGDMNWSDGSYYTGEWKHGLYHGKGRYHRREYTYEGEWLEGEYHGQGRLTWFNSGEYKGSWDHGKRSGHGWMAFSDGNVYEGDWEDDKINGWGVMTLADGSVQKGRFVDWVFDPSSTGEENPVPAFIKPPDPDSAGSVNGAPVQQQAQEDRIDPSWPVRSKTAAGLLAIFLGGIGVHKFYLGKVLQGVLYLLFCWTYIPSLVGFIEGIIYLSSSDVSFQLKNRVRIG